MIDNVKKEIHLVIHEDELTPIVRDALDNGKDPEQIGKSMSYLIANAMAEIGKKVDLDISDYKPYFNISNNFGEV